VANAVLPARNASRHAEGLTHRHSVGHYVDLVSAVSLAHVATVGIFVAYRCKAPRKTDNLASPRVAMHHDHAPLGNRNIITGRGSR